MNHSLISSSVTLRSLQQKLDIIANNMANLNTTGFKRKEATFEDILNNVRQQPPGFQKEGRLSPLGYVQGWGAKLSQVQMNLSQGTLDSTGIPTDLAIEGGALFELIQNAVDANGNRVNQTAYTRDGGFDLVVNPQDPGNVYLATKEGHYVKGADEQPIRIPAGYKLVVDSEGNVSYTDPGRPGDAAVPAGKLKLVRIVRPDYLKEIGENLFTVPAALNTGDRVVKPVDTNSRLEGKIAVRQGFVEQSNVNLSDEMTELMTVQRAFQLSSRALTSSDTMMNLANNLRG